MGGRSFKEDITDWESQCAAFQVWADEMLPGIWTIVLAANLALIVLYQNTIRTTMDIQQSLILLMALQSSRMST
jgi:hypothetical protein